MPAGIGAAGIVGIAFEVTPGTYVAPNKYIPIRSETLEFMIEPQFTRPIIRASVDRVHAVKGPAHVEGDIEWEVIEDMLPYFLHAGRFTVTKSGSAPNFIYDYKPASTGQEANKTLSITVVRNEQVFGYVGCVMGSLEITVDNGLLVSTIGIVGRNEATQALPTPTFPQTAPFGADSYDIEIPVGTDVTDAGSFTFSLDDSAEAQFRLGSLSAQYVKFGEREVSMEIERDFINKTEYDNFKALTAQSIKLRAQKPADPTNRFVEMVLRAGVMESYATGLDGQGELITAALRYVGKYDFTNTESVEIRVGTSEDIT